MMRGIVVTLLVATACAGVARAQVQPGETQRPGRRSLLGESPGEGGQPGRSPGDSESLLGAEPGIGSPRVPSGITRPGQEEGGRTPLREIPRPSPLPRSEAPLYGPLALPAVRESAGPAGGLTLDAAIERLVRENVTLRGQFLEIPQAEADVLTASLRANPLFYADATAVPYGNFSRNRPGGPTQYDVSITQPLDLSGKRKARTAAACRAKKVLEAQYQDAVRLEIDNLYTAFVDVLAARETILLAEAGVRGLDAMVESTREQQEHGLKNEADVKQMLVQRHTAELGLSEAKGKLRRAKRALAELLNVPTARAEGLDVRGRLRDDAPPPPPVQNLVTLALESRPDLVAYRLGIARAQADVKLARANRYADAYLLYAPYVFLNNAPTENKSAHAWSVGLTVPMPLYNRNQGNIARARINVSQTRLQLAAVERRVVGEVEDAAEEYRLSREAVERLERVMLPEALDALEDRERNYRRGDTDGTAYLEARREYNDLVRDYRDVVVRHRRSMLGLNTAVGARVMP